jgi:hypothetical protein
MPGLKREARLRAYDPPAGPKPLRRGEGPGIHLLRKGLSKVMDCRVKPGNDERTNQFQIMNSKMPGLAGHF